MKIQVFKLKIKSLHKRGHFDPHLAKFTYRDSVRNSVFKIDFAKFASLMARIRSLVNYAST